MIGELKVKENLLCLESAEGGLIPIAQVIGDNQRLISSLTVMHAVCKDTDMDVMEQMQSAGLTFKKAWQRAVMNQVAEILADITGVEVEAIPITNEMLKEIIGGENETKH